MSPHRDYNLSPQDDGNDEAANIEGQQVAIKEHAYYCFDVVHAKLHHLPAPEPPRIMTESDEEYPLFVTWNMASRSSPHHYRLRGCIGNFEPLNLVEGLRDYAAISAFKDHRFDPISVKELPRLQCGVSLLTDFELCNLYTDWSIEKHGIYIQLPNPALGCAPPYVPPDHRAPLPLAPMDSMPTSEVNSSTTSLTTSSSETGDETSGTNRDRYRSISRLPKFDPWAHHKGPSGRPPNPHKLPWVLTATYLPDVALEQGWTKVEAIDSAIRKAGYGTGRGGKAIITEEIRKSARVTRYQSRKVTVSYDEWREWKELESGQGQGN